MSDDQSHDTAVIALSRALHQLQRRASGRLGLRAHSSRVVLSESQGARAHRRERLNSLQPARGVKGVKRRERDSVFPQSFHGWRVDACRPADVTSRKVDACLPHLCPERLIVSLKDRLFVSKIKPLGVNIQNIFRPFVCPTMMVLRLNGASNTPTDTLQFIDLSSPAPVKFESLLL